MFIFRHCFSGRVAKLERIIFHAIARTQGNDRRIPKPPMVPLGHSFQSKHSRSARLVWAFFCLALLFVTNATTLRSQQNSPNSGSVKVLVRDAQGRGVPGAVCQLARLAEPSSVLS